MVFSPTAWMIVPRRLLADLAEHAVAINGRRSSCLHETLVL
jgi:hypothetical protein